MNIRTEEKDRDRDILPLLLFRGAACLFLFFVISLSINNLSTKRNFGQIKMPGTFKYLYYSIRKTQCKCTNTNLIS